MLIDFRVPTKRSKLQVHKNKWNNWIFVQEIPNFFLIFSLSSTGRLNSISLFLSGIPKSFLLLAPPISKDDARILRVIGVTLSLNKGLWGLIKKIIYEL